MPSYVVTGASRGLGYAFISQLAKDGSNTVIGLVRNKAATDKRLAKDGITNVTIFQADIIDTPALAKASDEIGKLLGDQGLDYLINNAALSGDSGGGHVDLTYFEKDSETLKTALIETFEVNVTGVANTIIAFLPLIKQGKTKKVIALSTGMADIDLINEFNVGMSAPYAISKAAVNALIAKFNVAYAPQGILFMAVSPGFVDTAEGKQMSPEDMEKIAPMVQSFQKYAPHFTGPLTPEQSVGYVLKLAERATVEEYGGKFVSHFGNKQWL